MVMAMHTWCITCESDTLHHNSKCTDCTEREHRLERAKWLALTDGERIEILLKRIEKLERGPMTF